LPATEVTASGRAYGARVGEDMSPLNAAALDGEALGAPSNPRTDGGREPPRAENWAHLTSTSPAADLAPCGIKTVTLQNREKRSGPGMGKLEEPPFRGPRRSGNTCRVAVGLRDASE
jgi:hypothetical protein